MGEPGESRKEASAGLVQYSTENLVPFGPIHPALKEPEYFKLYLRGETIVDVIPRIGYVHRGLEKAAEQRRWTQNTYMFERTCGICSFAHSLAYVQAVEGLTTYEIPERALYIRLIVAELERIHSHLLWAGLLGHWAGFDTLFMWVWRDREIVLDLMEAVAGNRVHKSLATIAGVKKDIPDSMKSKIVERTKHLTDRAYFYKGIVDTESTLLMRTRKVGNLKAEMAQKLCAVGPLVRAAGVPRDVRADDPYAAYGDVPLDVVTRNDGDVYSLLHVRLDEIVTSANAIDYALEHMPKGPIRLKIPPTIPAGEYSTHIEAPRGELFYFVKSSGTAIPERVKARTPTLANLPTALELLKGYTMADVPVVLTAIDPCFGCMDRLSFVDLDSQKKWSWTGEQLREYGIKHYFPERNA
ncbi:nickel-dependent hydrogenase large subunit [Candidatus Bathyarchaeota archaeon]|nr:nickel-dependent hydrogenase large subunit [Candidatus Bathyarchaeota archaeon]